MATREDAKQQRGMPEEGQRTRITMGSGLKI